jgi:hypothetical protein
MALDFANSGVEVSALLSVPQLVELASADHADPVSTVTNAPMATASADVILNPLPSAKSP